MILNWLHNGIVVDGSTLKPPKDLILMGTKLAYAPRSYRVYQVYSPAAEALRRLLHQPERRQITDLPVRKGKKDKTYEAKWHLAPPIGCHFAAQYVFTTGQSGEQSWRIRSHRLGAFEIGGGTGSSFTDPTHTVPGGMRGGIKIKLPLIAAVDPQLIFAAATDKDLLRHVFEEAFGDSPSIPGRDGSGGMSREDMWRSVRDAYSATYTIPYDWSFAVSPEEITAEEGSETVIELTVDAPSPGSGLFAISASEPLGSTDNVLSDIIEIQADEDGRTVAYVATEFGEGSNEATA